MQDFQDLTAARAFYAFQKSRNIPLSCTENHLAFLYSQLRVYAIDFNINR
jgi:hypothetical protein